MPNHLFDALVAPHADNPACFVRRAGLPDMSFAAFAALTGRLAHVLAGLGVGVGDRVTVQAPKCIEMVALYVATIRVGGVFLPLNTAYTVDEVAYFVGDAQPKVLICDGARDAALRPLAAAHGATRLTLNADGSGSLTDGLDGHPDAFPNADRGPDDLAALLYTSGTTGRSKGAMLSHGNLVSNTEVLRDHWRITDADTLIHALPIFHTHGLFVATNTVLLAGGCMRFLPGFDLDAMLEAMPSSTLLMGVPTFYT
ncbi:MAG: AMP-binding protein, partial [Pseudomonadota bacterium]